MPIPRSSTTRRPSAACALVCGAALIFAGACTHRPAVGSDSGPALPPDNSMATSAVSPDDLGAIMLHVDNHGWDDMVLYAVRGNLRDRIGRVTAAGRWSVALDKWIDAQGGQLQIVAMPAGTRSYGVGASATTPLLSLRPGQSVWWTIEKDLVRSFVEVR